jgi:hypothetical protein
MQSILYSNIDDVIKQYNHLHKSYLKLKKPKSLNSMAYQLLCLKSNYKVITGENSCPL